jgi:type VI secretion system protein ImpH
VSGFLKRLAGRARRTRFVQAVRQVELAARLGGRGQGVGGDAVPADEPIRFVASDRMAMPVGDLADVGADTGDRTRIVANILGLVGASAVLPPYYSEVQLRRRRLRDLSMADFYNIFDHRALSFFYRAARKYHWLIGHERAGGGPEPVTDALLAYGGLPTPASRDRLRLNDGILAPLAGHLADGRRSAASLAVVLRHLTGLDLRVREAVPTWLALPAAEQTRLGGPGRGHCARLGDGGNMAGEAGAALVGAAVLDVQHHYEIEVGPLDGTGFAAFVAGGALLTRLEDACRLMTGVEHRARLRLLVRRDDAPPLRLGSSANCLSRTTWLGVLSNRPAVLDDCTIPLNTRHG